MSYTKNVFAIGLALLWALSALTAQANPTDRELREQRNAAQKERREAKRDRDQTISDATKVFRDFTRNLETEYREKARQLDTEFQLKQVQLQAEQNTKVAAAEAEFKRKWTSLFLAPSGADVPNKLQNVQAEAKAYSDELFRLRKEAAQQIHQERVAIQTRKDDLFKEMDQAALRYAEELGLTKAYEPIRATAIGGELTRQEEQWNDGELKAVERLMERNAQTVAKFVYGEKLRAWERANMEEDFQLQWDERSQLQAIESEQSIFSTFMMQGGQSKEVDHQALMDRIAELGQQQQVIKIQFDQRKKENTIKRNEARRQITGR